MRMGEKGNEMAGQSEEWRWNVRMEVKGKVRRDV